jgi:hypothetical protein
LFPAGPSNGEAVTPRQWSLGTLGPDESAEFREHTLMNRRIGDHAPAAIRFFTARFELRFDQRDQMSTRSNQGVGPEAGRNRREMNEQSSTARSKGTKGCREMTGGKLAGIDAFEDEHARVLAQFPGELTACRHRPPRRGWPRVAAGSR